MSESNIQQRKNPLDVIVDNFFKEESHLKNLYQEMIGRHDFLDYDLNPSSFPDFDKNWNGLHDICKECIFRQIHKYKEFPFDGNEVLEPGVIGNKFLVNCQGIPKEYVTDDQLRQIGIDPESETGAEAKASVDPIKWAERYLKNEDGSPWVARKYQEVMIRCSSNRVVFRCGRRIGKSPINQALISTDRGILTAKECLDLYNSGEKVSILSLNMKTLKYEFQEIKCWDQGLNQAYRVKTKRSRAEEMTDEHPFLVWRDDSDLPQWIHAKDLKVGDKVALPNRENQFGNKSIGKDLAELLGYFVGDGGTTKSASFSNDNKETVDRWKELCLKFGATKFNFDGRCTYTATAPDKKNNPVIDLLRKYNLYSKKSIHKSIPVEIFTAPKEEVSAFLEALFVCDGWVSVQDDPRNTKNKRIEVGYCSSSKKLFEGVRRLLVNYGIFFSHQSEKKTNYKEKTTSQLVIKDRVSLRNFLSNIKIGYKTKKLKDSLDSSTYSSNTPSWKDLLPLGVWNLIKKKQDKLGYTNLQVTGTTRKDSARLRTKSCPTKSKVQSYLKNLDEISELTEYCGNHIVWDEIIEIKDLGKQPTVGLEVKNTNTIVNEMITHNTIALAVHILFSCFAQPFYAKNEQGYKKKDENGNFIKTPTRVLIITPRQSHADNIMNEIIGFLKRTPELQSEIKGKVRKTPYYIIEFNNGSWIKCLTAGTGTAGAGMSIRGFSAEMLVMDEANYLGAAELKAALAILVTNRNTQLRVSSTPRGLQDFFWKWCMRDPVYKEFWFPTPLLPHWKSQKSAIYSDVQTMDDFQHEYMASFSAPDSGVFAPNLILRAQQPYYYDQCYPQLGRQYAIGVDWNINAGNEIVVTEYDRLKDVYRVVEAVNVPKSEWTQTKALDKIIELVKKWQPFALYVDEGNGGTQIEVLKETSLKSKDRIVCGIKDILTSYNFSSNIVIKDPETQEIKKKPAKPFLVQNAVRRFEEGVIELSANDAMLIEQLGNYIVKRVSSSGKPIYAMDKQALGDHRLDAFMLSLVAFRLELGEDARNFNAVSDVNFVRPTQNPNYEQYGREGKMGDGVIETKKTQDEDQFSKNVENQTNMPYNRGGIIKGQKPKSHAVIVGKSIFVSPETPSQTLTNKRISRRWRR